MIHIAITAYDRPEFLDIQAALIARFCSVPHRVTVFQDRGDPEIASVCRRRGLRHVSCPEEWGPMAVSETSGRMASWQYEAHHRHSDDDVLMIDADVFPIATFGNRLETHPDSPIASPTQYRPCGTKDYEYIWPSLCWMRMAHLRRLAGLIDFSCASLHGHWCDTGGASHWFLRQHHITPQTIHHDARVVVNGADVTDAHYECRGLDGTPMRFEMFEQTWLHSRGSCGWNGRHPEKDRLLLMILDGLLP